MKILIIGSDDLAYNGRVAKTRQQMETMGFEVSVLRLHISSPSTHDTAADLQALSPSPMINQGNRLARKFAARRRFRLLLKNAFLKIDKVAPDILHVMDPYALKAASLWRRKRQHTTDIVFDACEWFEGTAAGNASVASYVRRTLSNHGTSITEWLCPSMDLAEIYRAQYPSWPQPHLFGNVPDWDTDHIPKKLDSPLRKIIKVSADELIFLYSGAFNPRRGLEALLASTVAMPEHAHLVFMGFGPLLDTIRQELALHPRKNVHLIPPVAPNALPKWLAGADVGLIPYETDVENHRIATPNKLYEFPSAGVPIIASNLPVIRAIIMTHGIGQIAHSETLGQNSISGEVDWGRLVEMALIMADDPDIPARLKAFATLSKQQLLSGLTTLYESLAASRI